jgi:hypothetical protein
MRGTSRSVEEGLSVDRMTQLHRKANLARLGGPPGEGRPPSLRQGPSQAPQPPPRAEIDQMSCVSMLSSNSSPSAARASPYDTDVSVSAAVTVAAAAPPVAACGTAGIAA